MLWEVSPTATGQGRHVYLKPKKLHFELRQLFKIKPMITAERAYGILKSMRDADGGLMFCWTKRGKVGKYAKTSLEYAAWEGCSMCRQKTCSGFNGGVHHFWRSSLTSPIWHRSARNKIQVSRSKIKLDLDY